MTHAEERFTVEHEAGVSIIVVEGEFDMAQAETYVAVAEPVMEAEGPILVDLSSCEFIDSTALACLFNTFKTAKQRGRAHALVGSSRQVSTVLDQVGMNQFVRHHEDRPEALRELTD
jgi:anti-anti-sigma factor